MSDFFKDIRNRRRDYQGPELNRDSVPDNPMVLFGAWLADATDKEVTEPLAMSLATADTLGQPSVRIVLLRDFDENGFVFYTNYLSRKGVDIEMNPKASLNFFWAVLSRQVRIEGAITKIDPLISDDYFASRPRGSQIGAWASAQSEAVESRVALDQKVKELEVQYEGKQIPRPPHWGGYRVIPRRIEFWQGRENRLHDRVLYVRQNLTWSVLRLAP